MFWMDFATCQQRLSARSTGNTLQNPLGKAGATKKCRADTLLVCVTGFPGLGYRKWLWDSRPWEGKHTAVGGLADPSGVFHWELLRLAYLFPSACAWSVLRGPNKGQRQLPRGLLFQGTTKLCFLERETCNAGVTSLRIWAPKKLELNPNSNYYKLWMLGQII